MSDSATPGTVAHQAPLSIGLPSQEYWSGLPFPPPGDLPNPGIEPGCPALQADSLPSDTAILMNIGQSHSVPKPPATSTCDTFKGS